MGITLPQKYTHGGQGDKISQTAYKKYAFIPLKKIKVTSDKTCERILCWYIYGVDEKKQRLSRLTSGPPKRHSEARVEPYRGGPKLGANLIDKKIPVSTYPRK
jgi:hypothetical protein